MKKCCSLLLSVFLCLLLFIPVACAEHTDSHGDENGNWSVNFTGSGMISHLGALDRIVQNIEPGDDISVYVTISNSSQSDTMWYMHNEAFETLEKMYETAVGGGYTYELYYVDAHHQKHDLFNPEYIGGNNAPDLYHEGLNQISDKLENYFYLDTLAPGDQAEIQIHMSLDGESQGNGYQNTLGGIELQFGVEPIVTRTEKKTTTLYSTRPKTGDGSSISTYLLLAAVALGGFIMSMRMKKKNCISFVLALLCVASFAREGTVAFAGNDDYQHVVKLYAGNIGLINGKSEVTVTTGSFNANNYEITIRSDDPKYKKYYVKGIRKSGHDIDDANEKVNAAFAVTEDCEYCVSYGVIGDQVSYNVQYLDYETKKPLLTFTVNGKTYGYETKYCNRGDKPIVAYRDVKGYQPYTNNLTGTVNENGYTFTFWYKAVQNVIVEETTNTVVTETGGDAANTGGNANAAAQNGQGNETNQPTENAESTPLPEEQADGDETPASPQPEAVASAVPEQITEPEPVSTPSIPVPTFNPESYSTAEPVALVDLDEEAANAPFTIGDVAVPLATLQARAELGSRAAKVAIALKYTGYVLLVLLLCALITAAITLSNRKRAAKSAYTAAPIRDMSYDSNTKAVYYSPSDYNVEDLFDRRS